MGEPASCPPERYEDGGLGSSAVSRVTACGPGSDLKPVSDTDSMAIRDKNFEGVIPFFQLFAFADSFDYLLMTLGSIGAIMHGLALPMFFLFFGKLLNGFGSNRNNPEQAAKEVSKYSVYFLYLGIALLFACWAEVACWMQTGERQAARLRTKYLESLLKQDVGFFDVETRTGDIVDSISSDTLRVQDAISEKMGNYMHYMATFVGGFAVAFSSLWRLALVTLAVVPAMVLAGYFYTNAITGLTSKSQAAYAEAGSIAEQAISQVRTVYAFVGESRTIQSYANALQSTLKLGFKGGMAKGLGLGVTYGLLFCSWALLLWYGGVLVRDHNANGGKVLSTIFAVIIGGISLGQSAPSLGAFAQARAAGFKITQMINRTPMMDISAPDSKCLPDVKGAIDLVNIEFSYPSRPGVMVFRNFSLSIAPGKTVAIVGSSGSGKSTVISLIERFYDPSSGEILLDGHDIRTLQLKWYREQIGLVNQEPALFATTIRSNILYGKEDGSTEEIEKATKAANAHGFISQLPHGYETQVGEKGGQLSGGQKQRVAISRAMLKNPAILLLDEATSALDASAEHEVQEALDRLMVGRTTVVVAHRLSTVRHADTIAVVQNGSIIEMGSHYELLEKGEEGAYTTLVRLQEMAKSMDISVSRDSRLSRGGSSRSGRRLSHQSSVGSDGSFRNGADMPSSIEVIKSAPKASYWRLAKLNLPEWHFALLGSLGSVASGLINPFFALIISSVLKTYYEIDNNKMKREVNKYAYIFIGLSAVSVIVYFTQHFFFGLMGESLTKRVREMMFAAILRNEISWFDRDDNNSAQIAARLTSDATNVKAAIGDRLSVVVQNSSLLIATITIGVVLQWRMALVVLATFPLLVGAGFAENMFLKGFAGDIGKAHSKATMVAAEAVTNIRTVAAFNAQSKVLDLFEQQLEGPKSNSFVRGQVAGIGYGLSQFFAFSSYGLGLWYGGTLVKDHLANFGDVVKVFLVLIMSAFAVAETLSLTPDLVKGGQALISVFSVLDRKTEIDADDAEGQNVDDVKGEIELKNVEFAYPARPDVVIFKDLNLKIQSGHSLALVGASGSGKSSVIALIERFYDPNAGRVMVDGRDIRKLNLRSLRKHMALVQQEPSLFAASIHENILYGKESASEVEIIEASKAANAHTFISALPDGYRTDVGERGVQLSGGQKQRVAIARAVLRNPAILLLDEATSALDAESEKIVQEALDRLMQGRTTVVIAHRLSTIRNANTIAVVQDGTIIEQGSHKELITRKGGAYCKLINLQQFGS